MHERRQGISPLGAAFLVFLALGLWFSVPTSAGQDFRQPSDPPQAHYTIEVTLDPANGVLRGSETISLKNGSPQPLEIVALEWLPRGAARALEVKQDDVTLPVFDRGNGPQDSPLVYRLAKPLKAGAEVLLHVTFTDNFPKGSASDLSLVGSWHPRLWREGLLVRDAYKVKLGAPPGYALAASGRLDAASGYYENENVTTSFGIYLAKGLSTAEKKSGDVLITALFDKDGEACARFCLDKAAGIIAFYRDLFGFFPRRFLYILPGAPRPMGGYPFASGIVVIHGEQVFASMPPLHWEWITAHEIGHQYWGEYVMSDDYPYSYIDSWLMIGLGICTDHAYIRHKRLSEEKHQAFLDRYLQGIEKRLDTTEDATESLLKRQNYDRNNILIHGKGFSILSALECVLGRNVFVRILQQSLKDYGAKRLGYRQFWKLAESVNGESLGWFFEPWVRSSKYLCYQIVSRDSTGERIRYTSKVVVEASLDSMLMPVPVKAVFEDGTSQVVSTDRLLRTSTLRFESRSKLKEVILDPEGQLAILKSPPPTLPEDLPDLIGRLPWHGADKDAWRVFELARNSQLKDADLWFSLGIKLVDPGYYAEAFESMKRVLGSNPSKEWHFIALTWLDREKALSSYREALKFDTGGTAMRHDQWGISINRAWVKERLKTPFKLEKK
jgi:hypothetical protein